MYLFRLVKVTRKENLKHVNFVKKYLLDLDYYIFGFVYVCKC